MQSKFGFTKFTASEFETWFAGVSVSRQVNFIQHHHTWSPNYSHAAAHEDFTLQKNMQHHHVANNGWSDIGQHFSIFPDGSILTGRSLNAAPACIFGANRHAICIESVGNFDTGHDQMRAAQRDAIIRATAAMMKRFSNIPHDENGVVYHHWYDLNTGQRRDGAGVTKSCPGTGYFGGNKVADFRAHLLPQLLAVLGGGAPAPIPPAPLPKFVVVTASALNIRTGPGTDHDKITEHGPTQQGSVLRVYEEVDGWFRVANSKQHWVFGRHTQAVQPGTINTVDSNCRSGTSTQFPIVMVFQPGARVYVHETSGSWSRIGVDQWVHSSLITLD